MSERREKQVEVVVIAKCIGCGSKREIKAEEVPKGQMPMCKCGMPMIAEQAMKKGARR